MISAVVDSNVFVRGVITSNPNSASKGVIDAFLAAGFSLLLSREALDELHRVLSAEELQAKHQLTNEEILEFCHIVEAHGRLLEPTIIVPASMTRDVTDTKWIALALCGDADYLVTLDRRHLQRLKKVGRTKIVGPAKFLRLLHTAK